MASAGFEPPNFGTERQHATPRPPKPLSCMLSATEMYAIREICMCVRYWTYFSLIDLLQKHQDALSGTVL